MISKDYSAHGQIQRGEEHGSGPPLKNHKNKGFPIKTGPDRLKNHKANKPASNVGPSSFAVDDPLIVVFGPLIVVFGPLIVVFGPLIVVFCPLIVVFGSFLPSSN